MSPKFQIILLGFIILLPGAWVSDLSSVESIAYPPTPYITDIWDIESTPVLPSPKTPPPTQIAILPVVKQDGSGEAAFQNQQAPTATQQPADTPTPTLTPTFIPPQDMTTNTPIVFGAMVIVILIVMSWVFVSRRELQASRRQSNDQ
jgi:hypothetical protein